MSCTCHSIRENSSGISFSYAILGVLCPECEWASQQDADEYTGPTYLEPEDC